MRIIDKNVDFYDYIQYVYKDDTFTFDRRDSYVMSKSEIATYLLSYEENYLLIQICHTFWLFEVIPTKRTDSGILYTDYEIKLMETWKNYNSKRELIKLSLIDIDFSWFIKNIKRKLKISDYVDAINRNGIKTLKVFNKFVVYKDYKFGSARDERHIPIMCNLGIASLVDHFEVYNSLEEYFSEEKTDSERTEPNGMTNNDKVEAHGFDVKTSFRNM